MGNGRRRARRGAVGCSDFAGITASLPTGSKSVSSSGLILALNMEDLEGALMEDHSGNDLDFTIVGPDDAAGVVGRGRDFVVANSDQMTHAADAAFDGKRTIAMWFAPTGGYDSGESTNRFLFIHRDLAGDNPGVVINLVASDGKLQVANDNGAFLLKVLSTTDSWTDSFHHMAMVADGTDMLLYVDGVEENSASFTTDFDDSSDTVRIGTATSEAAFMDGDIDELLIFSRALSPSEILNLATLC